MTTTQDKKKPALTLRFGNLNAAIWKNQGEQGEFYNATLSRTYRNADGQVRDASSFSLDDLEALQYFITRITREMAARKTA